VVSAITLAYRNDNHISPMALSFRNIYRPRSVAITLCMGAKTSSGGGGWEGNKSRRFVGAQTIHGGVPPSHIVGYAPLQTYNKYMFYACQPPARGKKYKYFTNFIHAPTTSITYI